jgi:hypothetical protein
MSREPSAPRVLVLLLTFLLAPAAARAGASLSVAAPVAIPLRDGAPGIGFDDLRYAPGLRRVLVPAGRTGRLLLLDPETRAVLAVGGFRARERYAGGHDFGATSADAGADLLFVTDRTARRLVVVDPHRLAIVSSAPLAAEPDYVRYVPGHQLWVTEPSAEQIEVFSLASPASPPARVGSIPVPGGPESLGIDPGRGRAFANLWQGRTVAIDLAARRVVADWPNGCRGSRGLALDEASGRLLVACAEGVVRVLDAPHGGKPLSQASVGRGVDGIAWSATRRHVYAPAARAATLTILALSPSGRLSRLASVSVAEGSHCAAADDAGRVFVCDPAGGRLLELRDPHPPGP